ncbi:MAG TPA: hypothetical protein VIL55_08525 [Naasia sp.]
MTRNPNMVIPPPFAGYPSFSAQWEIEREQRIGGPNWKPGWTRVWRDGVDVTDQPDLWPWPWNPDRRHDRR